MKKRICVLLAAAVLLGITGCGSASSGEKAAESPAQESETGSAVGMESGSAAAQEQDETVLHIDIAASLEAVFVNEIIPEFESENQGVSVEYNTGSSGTLLSGIEEANGIGHDLFFSAGKAQVTTLDETDGLVVDGSTVNLLSNELCLVKGNETQTNVTGWDTLNQAESLAICPGSVPVGKYTRIALISLGYLEDTDDPTAYTGAEISEALGGVSIDEADDVEAAAAKAVEESVDAAFIYHSDYYNHQDDLTIIAQDDGTLTGAISYPVCLVKNPQQTEKEQEAAEDLLDFLQTDFCLKAFEEYGFIVPQ